MWLINKDCKSLNLTNSHTVNVFRLEDKIQNPSKCLLQFFLGGNVVNQRSGDGRFGGRLKNHRAQFRVFLISRILLDANKIIQNSYFKNKVSLEELHDNYDYFRVTGADDTVL